jgi:hypothetical protein
MTALATPACNLGFLTVLREPTGYLGGYLVTNLWGRPLEFRLSTAVQPNRVQQILYGDTLERYVCAELIGKTLVEKTATEAQIIATDQQAVLELRRRLEVPVILVPHSPRMTQGQPGETGEVIDGNVQCHARFPEDAVVIRALLDRLQGLDLAEPFARIREAITEARKLGVTSRG